MHDGIVSNDSYIFPAHKTPKAVIALSYNVQTLHCTDVRIEVPPPVIMIWFFQVGGRNREKRLPKLGLEESEFATRHYKYNYIICRSRYLY
jgi:hypothetical protein